MIGEPARHWTRIERALERDGRVAVVTLVEVAGSSPREAGARLIVHVDGTFSGTIGGGALEWQALAEAQGLLGRRDGPAWREKTFSLGPDLGQCCGGRVVLGFERFDAAALDDVRALARREAEGPFVTVGRRDAGAVLRRVVDEAAFPHDAVAPTDRTVAIGPDGLMIERFGGNDRTLLIFGAGHVGRALVLALAPLPFRVLWIDGRPDAFPTHVPRNVALLRPKHPVEVLAEAPEDALVLVMTHSHALDLEIVDAALRRGTHPYVGAIGSATKRARFVRRLAEMGHDGAAIEAMVCPVGAAGPKSKLPAVIAAAVTVELLVADEAAAVRAGSGLDRGVEPGTTRSARPDKRRA